MQVLLLQPLTHVSLSYICFTVCFTIAHFLSSVSLGCRFSFRSLCHAGKEEGGGGKVIAGKSATQELETIYISYEYIYMYVCIYIARKNLRLNVCHTLRRNVIYIYTYYIYIYIN